MAVTIIATPGAANANSFLTLGEANSYFAARVALDPEWSARAGQEEALVMATRVLSSLNTPRRRLERDSKTGDAWYIVSRYWTGLPATTTQVLAWPRTGMRNMLGQDIPSDSIPQELKDATAELAGQLAGGDRTLDNDIKVQGITSLRAGSVSLSFKDVIDRAVLPDAVIELMPSWWFVDETVEPARDFAFKVL
jgi:hypothetical protein